MDQIPTTTTAVQKLKRLARDRRKSSGEKLAAALDAIARQDGYQHWKHVTLCLAASGTSKANRPALPEVLHTFLARYQAAQPASDDTAEALARGLVFAMDIKDADNERPEDEAEIHECEDAGAFVASDIWGVYLREAEEEGDDVDIPVRELLDDCRQYLDNYHFFRYSGTAVSKTVDDAFAHVLGKFFFPAVYVWIGGRFVDLAAR